MPCVMLRSYKLIVVYSPAAAQRQIDRATTDRFMNASSALTLERFATTGVGMVPITARKYDGAVAVGSLFVMWRRKTRTASVSSTPKPS
jgi:hypothetical protein